MLGAQPTVHLLTRLDWSFQGTSGPRGTCCSLSATTAAATSARCVPPSTTRAAPTLQEPRRAGGGRWCTSGSCIFVGKDLPLQAGFFSFNGFLPLVTVVLPLYWGKFPPYISSSLLHLKQINEYLKHRTPSWHAITYNLKIDFKKLTSACTLQWGLCPCWSLLGHLESNRNVVSPNVVIPISQYRCS